MKKKKHIFTDEEIKSLLELGEVLRGIHRRLIDEGKIRIDKRGSTIFLKTKNELKNSVNVT